MCPFFAGVCHGEFAHILRWTFLPGCSRKAVPLAPEHEQCPRGVERDHMMIVLDDYRGFTIKYDQTWWFKWQTYHLMVLGISPEISSSAENGGFDCPNGILRGEVNPQKRVNKWMKPVMKESIIQILWLNVVVQHASFRMGCRICWFFRWGSQFAHEHIWTVCVRPTWDALIIYQVLSMLPLRLSFSSALP